MKRDSLLEIFFTEAFEIFPELENDLVALEKFPDDMELINKIFRAAHTLKGGAYMVNLVEVTSFTHLLENVLDELRDQKIYVNNDLTTVLLSAVDTLKKMLDDISEGRGVTDKELLKKITDALKSYLVDEKEIKEPVGSKTAKSDTSDGDRYCKITMKFSPEIYNTGTDPLMFLKEFSEIGEMIDTVTDIKDIPDMDKINVFEYYMPIEVVLRTKKPPSKIEDIFLFVMNDNDIRIEDITEDLKPGRHPLAERVIGDKSVIKEEGLDDASEQQGKIGEILVNLGKVSEEDVNDALKTQETLKHIKKTTAIRVDTDKLDNLVNTVGEMVINVARVNQLTKKNNGNVNQDIISAVELLGMICRDIQEQVMLVRMLPIASTFNKFQRVVRDLASDGGKEVTLILSGTETELDKNVIEQLEDPFKHLVRNSVDHGIETPDDRVRAGKDRVGSIWLRAYQQEGSIFVEIQDDGKGIDKNRILEKAISLNLTSNDKNLSEVEIFNFMFEPGFSTAEKVTEISGRGVGLDVVKRNIENLRGNISVESTLGKGTKFTIMLPLTLAIIDGMNVQVGEEILTIPLLSVLELVRPKANELKTVAGREEVIKIREEYLPLVRLYSIFDYKSDYRDPTKALVVVVESAGTKFGILVDEVIGEQQAVIKSLDKNFFKKIRGVAGATILGDGQVSLILDIHSLEKLAFAQ